MANVTTASTTIKKSSKNKLNIDIHEIEEQIQQQWTTSKIFETNAPDNSPNK
jgi:leucyl-tRNA synthetase